MARYSVEFLKYLAGMREATTSLTANETRLLQQLAGGRSSVAEIGVYEGATSRAIAQVMCADGRLYLIDPFVRATRMERWLGFSAARYIASRSVAGHKGMVQFVESTSLEAAAALRLHRPAELIFIDADHAYEAVRADFAAWSAHLDPAGRIALHDSRICAPRPDLGPDAGPVRLVNDLLAGNHGRWRLVDAADSLSVFGRG